MAASDTLSVSVFRIGSQWLALETVLFLRWLESRPVHVVPGRTNEIFRGLVNVDGELLFAFDGARMMNPDESVGSTAARMFVASDGVDRFVFAVEEVLGIRRISRQALDEVPATLARAPSSLTRNAMVIEGRSVALLDAERFFGCAVRSLS
jgi:chemotaxis-related protein WspD